jgi:hypothetical protein
MADRTEHEESCSFLVVRPNPLKGELLPTQKTMVWYKWITTINNPTCPGCGAIADAD